MHIGQRIVEGDRLYIDVMDNKPPLIHYIDALGYWMTPGSALGIFLLCLLGALATVAALYVGLRPVIAAPWIILGCVIGIRAFMGLASTPNLTETWAVPLQALGLAFSAKSILDGRMGRHALACGIVTGLLFNLRPNNIGFGIAWGIFALISAVYSFRGAMAAIAKFAAGFLVVLAVVCAGMWIRGGFPEFVQQAFLEGARYSSDNQWVRHLSVPLAGLHLLWHSRLALGCFLVTLGLIALLWRKMGVANARLVGFSIVWIVIECAMSSISGYTWAHYFVCWLLPLVVFFIAGAHAVAESWRWPMLTPLAYGAAALFTAMLFITGAIYTWHRYQDPPDPDPALALARTYVRPGDLVTTWGDVRRNFWFDLDHKTGTRIFHQSAYTHPNVYRRAVSIFLDDLERNRPRLIIEKRSSLPLFAQPDPKVPLGDFYHPWQFNGWDDAAILARKQALAKDYQAVADREGFVAFVRKQ